LPSCISAPLPIELLDVTVKCFDNKVYIEWTTGSEQNNDYFKVKKLGILQEKVRIRGAGSTTTQRSYFWVDSEPQGENIYELWQVDYDGKETKMAVATVICYPKERIILWNVLGQRVR